MRIEVTTFPRIPTRQSNLNLAGPRSGRGEGRDENRSGVGALGPMWE